MKKILTALLLLFSTLSFAQTTAWSTSPTVTPQTRKYNNQNQVRFLWGTSGIYSIADSLLGYIRLIDTAKYSNYQVYHGNNTYYGNNTHKGSEIFKAGIQIRGTSGSGLSVTDSTNTNNYSAITPYDFEVGQPASGVYTRYAQNLIYFTGLYGGYTQSLVPNPGTLPGNITNTLPPKSGVLALQGDTTGLNIGNVYANKLNTVSDSSQTVNGKTKVYNSKIPYNFYNAHGTSITNGLYVDYPQDKYVNRIGAHVNLAVNNMGLSGGQAADIQALIYGSYVSATRYQLISQEIAANDVSYYGSDADKQANFKAIHAACVAWAALPNSLKQYGQSSTITYSGTWTNSTLYNGALSKVSNTNGNTATFTATGSAVYITYTLQDGNAGQFTVTVDGVSTGVTYNNYGQNSSLILTNQGRNYGSALLRIAGLSSGSHTVVITVTSATNVNNKVIIDWVGGNSGLVTGKPTVLVADAIQRFSSTNIATYTALIHTNLANLKADGLNIYEIPVPALNTSTQLAADGAHPNDAGHNVIAQAFIAKIDSLNGITAADSALKLSTVKQNGKTIATVTNNGIFTQNQKLYSPNSTYDGAPIGPETLSSSTWTTTGWTGAYPSFTHTTGNTNALSYGGVLSPNSPYSIYFGISSGTGSVSVSVGGITIATGLTQGVYAYGVYPTSTASIVFTPTTDFTCTIAAISVKPVIGQSQPLIQMFASDSTLSNEIRVNKGLFTYSIGVGAGAHHVLASNDFDVGFMAGGNSINVKFVNNFGTFAGYNSQGNDGNHIGAYSGYRDNGFANIAFGDLSSYLTTITGNNNVTMGANTELPDGTLSGQGNYQNLLYFSNATGFGNGYVGIRVKQPLAPLHIVPNNTPPQSLYGATLYPGVRVDVTSIRTGIGVIHTNDAALSQPIGNGDFAAIYPFDDNSNNNDGTYKPFRLSVGSTLVDVFWINKYGQGFFNGGLSVGTATKTEQFSLNGAAYFASTSRGSTGDGGKIWYDSSTDRLRFLSYFPGTTTYKPEEHQASGYNFDIGTTTRFALDASGNSTFSGSTNTFAAAMLQTTANAYSTGGYASLVRNTTSGRFETVTSNIRPAATRSSASTLTLAYGADYVFTGTTATYTMPAIVSTSNSGDYRIYVKNAGSGNITINTTGSLNVLYDTSLSNTFTLGPGSSITWTPDGTQFNR